MIVTVFVNNTLRVLLWKEKTLFNDMRYSDQRFNSTILNEAIQKQLHLLLTQIVSLEIERYRKEIHANLTYLDIAETAIARCQGILVYEGQENKFNFPVSSENGENISTEVFVIHCKYPINN